MLKIATWNLCLGLKNKKDTVYGCLNEEKIDIAMLQEVDIKKVSEAFGHFIGKNLKTSGLNFDIESFIDCFP